VAGAPSLDIYRGILPFDGELGSPG